MAESATGTPAGDHPGRRALRWAVAAGTFVIGLIVGGVLVGLLSGGGSDVPIATGTPAPASGGPGFSGAPIPTTAGATAEIVVNDACLDALNAAEDVSGTVDDLSQAAADVNLAQLDEVIRRLQPLAPRLQEGLQACHVVTRLPDGSTVSGTPTPSALPTGATATPSTD